ncbi:hypothetical protein GCM10027037_31470 [Mucilaginibacter koreensis]
MKKLYLLLLAISLVLGACKKHYPPYQLRIQNATGAPLNDVVLVSDNRTNHYGTVQINQTTGYLEYIDNDFSQLRIVEIGTNNVITFDLGLSKAYVNSPAATAPVATCIIKLVNKQYQIAFEK